MYDIIVIGGGAAGMTAALYALHADCAAGSTAAPSLSGPVLFTRSGCPNCKTSKLMLDKAGVKYSVVDAEQDAAMTRKYGVKKAPSLLVPNGDGFKTYDNASEIRKYIESIG